MYRPVKDGINKAAQSVRYDEIRPPEGLSGIVDCFWELKTDAILPDDFCLHALPDACVNILFNLQDTSIAAVTALHTDYRVLNLGTAFHYAGIQLLPGVWLGNRNEIADNLVETPYVGDLPLVETCVKLAALDFLSRQSVMIGLVQWFMEQKLVAADTVTAGILACIDDIHTVADMAAIAKLSPRQLQRTLKRTTGFSPHDLLKVLRLQHSFRGHYLASYADQSHYVHSFRKITGYTPAKYVKKFNV